MEMRKNKFFMMLAAAILLPLSCGGSKAAPEITVMSPEDDDPVIEEVVVPQSPWDSVSRILSRIHEPVFRSTEYYITKYGSVAGGAQDALPGITAAIKQCSEDGGGHVVVPRGTFLCNGPIHLTGGVDLHLEDGAELVFSTDASHYLPPVRTKWEGTELYNYSPLIYAYGVSNVAVTGSGTIIGKGGSGFQKWYSLQKADQEELRRMGREGVPVQERIFGDGHYLRPQVINFVRCTGVYLQGVLVKDVTFWSCHLAECTNVKIQGLSIISGGANSDGIDPESCCDVLIERCYFKTGDDGIAIKSGRDQDGWRIDKPSENIVVRGCTFNTDWNAVCMGSEISGGVRNVFVEDCYIAKATNGLYCKSNKDRGGYAEDVYFRNIKVDSISGSLVLISSKYRGGETTQDYPTPMRRFSFENISAVSAVTCLGLDGFTDLPIEDVTVKDVSIMQCPTPLNIKRYKGLVLDNVTVAGEILTAPADY